MLRMFRPEDLDAVASLWLEVNLEAHAFIAPQYWQGQAEAVKSLLPQAELYVYEDEQGVQGFLGLDGDFIAGIFVRSGARSRGIGRQLLDAAKEGRSRLTLSVYRKNRRAASFYRREGFSLQREQTDENTGEAEALMVWER